MMPLHVEQGGHRCAVISVGSFTRSLNDISRNWLSWSSVVRTVLSGLFKQSSWSPIAVNAVLSQSGFTQWMIHGFPVCQSVSTLPRDTDRLVMPAALLPASEKCAAKIPRLPASCQLAKSAPPRSPACPPPANSPKVRRQDLRSPACPLLPAREKCAAKSSARRSPAQTKTRFAGNQ